MKVKFEVVGTIKTKQRPRARVVNSRYAQVYTPQETIIYENYIKSEYQRQVKRGYFGLNPLSIEVKAYFEMPKLLKDRVLKISEYTNIEDKFICTTHKDFDNIYKTVCDALNGVAYEDDKQIWNDMGFKKFYTLGQERLEITLSDDLTDEVLQEDNIKVMYLQIKEYEKAQEKIRKLSSKSKLKISESIELNRLREIKKPNF